MAIVFVYVWVCVCVCVYVYVYVYMCMCIRMSVCVCVRACEGGSLGVSNATLETVAKRTVQMQLQQKHASPGARKSSAGKTSAEVNLIKTHRHTLAHTHTHTHTHNTHITAPSKHPTVDRGPNAVAFNKHFSLTAQIKCDTGPCRRRVLT